MNRAVNFLLRKSQYNTIFRQAFCYQFTSAIPAKTTEVNGDGFYMQQLFTGCLAEFAYYIESNKEVAIIDPLRDVDQYINLANQRGSKIKYIFLTHFHADFIAGHLDLQKKTGAQIIMGPKGEAPFVNQVVPDGQLIPLGDTCIQVLHTPGHTMESSCFLLLDKYQKKHSIYTGDTVFLGEVGRPDLAVKSDLTKEQLAAYLYESIKKHILSQPDELIIYPGHGAGSSCGKSISSGHYCTVGNQKQKNYALKPMSKQDFVAVVTKELPKPPQYFFYNATTNKTLKSLQLPKKVELSVTDVEKLLPEVVVIDSRDDANFEYIPNSVNIPLQAQFAHFLGSLFPPQQKFLIVAEEGKEDITYLRFSRIGYDNIVGHLKGGFNAWKTNGKQISKIQGYNPKEFLKQEGYQLVDLRRKGEWENGYLKNAQIATLDVFRDEIGKLDKRVKVYCGGGVRAKIAATLLKSLNYDVIYCNVGYGKIVEEASPEVVKP